MGLWLGPYGGPRGGSFSYEQGIPLQCTVALAKQPAVALAFCKEPAVSVEFRGVIKTARETLLGLYFGGTVFRGPVQGYLTHKKTSTLL